MRRLILIVLTSCMVFTPGRTQDSQALIPYLTEMIVGLGAVSDAVSANEERLQEIKKVMKTVKDFEEFARQAIAVREAINTLVCLSESMTELQIQELMMRIGAPTSNVFSNFMECQYEIFYSTLDLDYEGIQRNITRAFDPSEELNVLQRIELIEISIRKIQELRMKTVRAKASLLLVLETQIKLYEHNQLLKTMNKI